MMGEEFAWYMAQLEEMNRRSMEWRTANPDVKVKIQFNYPPGSLVICSISDAIKKGIVSVNDAGLALIKSMGKYGEADEPTARPMNLLY